MEITDLYWDYIKKGVLIRKFEEKLLELYSSGEFGGTVHTCIGQELNGIVASNFLHDGDSVFSNHRGHGHYISKTGKVKELFSEILGYKEGSCGGIGGSQHLFDKENNFYSSGIQGGMLPIAAGISMANKINKNGFISVAFIGDGTLGEGIVYETMNIISKWSIPLTIILENNRIAQSTSFEQSFSGNIEKRVNGFGIKYYQADGQSLKNLNMTISEAISFTRTKIAPSFVEIDSSRLMSHSKGDDNRADSVIKNLQDRDLLNFVKTKYPKEYSTIEISVENYLESKLIDAKNGTKLISFQDTSKPVENKPVKFKKHKVYKSERVNQLINNWFKNVFNKDSSYILLGEDIQDNNQYNPKKYGGAFKVTKELSDLFPKRVINTPISEAAIIGIGTGLAISGFKPIIEIMFGDFLTLGFDQIQQHASKLKHMYNNGLEVPLIIRTPMGGRRGYGPTHSQSIEKFFLGIPDLNVIVLNNRIEPSLIYNQIQSHLRSPSLVIENKILYTKSLSEKVMPGFELQKSDEIFPTVKIVPIKEKPVCTIVCYGEMLDYVEKAAELAFVEDEIVCDIISPSILFPMNINPYLESLDKTKRIIVAEEGPNFASWSSELIANLIESVNFEFKVKRIGMNSIIPTAITAEENLIPNVNKILKLIKEINFG